MFLSNIIANKYNKNKNIKNERNHFSQKPDDEILQQKPKQPYREHSFLIPIPSDK